MELIKTINRKLIALATKKLYKHMPSSLRGYILRRNLRINYDLPEQINFEVAQSKEDLESAYRLVHDTYVREGYSDTQESGMRISLQNALPSTTTIVAKYQGKVVGTLTIIRANPFGLPMEKLFQLSHLKTNNMRLVEVSGLAVDKSFFRRKGDLSLPLMKLTFDYCLNYFGADYIVVSVNPKAFEFYNSILKFMPLVKNAASDEDYVKGAPAVGFYFNLHTMEKTWERLYKNVPKERNIRTFMLGLNYKQIRLPKRTYHKINDPLLAPQDLDYFFRKSSFVFEKMTDFERHILRSIYNNPSYKEVIPKPSTIFTSFYKRKEIRFETSTTGRILSLVKPSGTQYSQAKVTNVSMSGVQIDKNLDLEIGQSLGMNISISKEKTSRILAEVCFRNESCYGLRILNSDIHWINYISYLEKDQIKTSNTKLKSLSLESSKGKSA